MSELLIVGAGTVGRATGRGLGARGHTVAFADTDARTIAALRAGGHDAMTVGDIEWANVDVVFVCVPTRADSTRSAFDDVLDAIDVVGAGVSHSDRRVTVAIRSTLTPGTADGLIVPRLERAAGGRVGVDFGFAVNPEFLRTATVDLDFDQPWVTVVGATDEPSGEAIAALFAPFGAPVIRCTPLEAELIKIGSNCFNAVKISYFNELHALAIGMGADSDRVNSAIAAAAEGMWNPAYGTRGGTPFGGACLPQDIENMARASRENGWDQRLIEATLEINQRMANGNNRHRQTG
jgi:UDPglucose 6-dehydrogenase